jgi:hypothetical protein
VRELPDFFRLTRVFSCEFAACCGTGRKLHLLYGVCACCALVAAYNASRMLLGLRCPVPAAHEMQQCRVVPIASRMCSRPLACRLLSVVRCLLHALPAACRLLRGVSRMLQTTCSRVAWCPLHAVFATLAVVYCMHVARCMLRHRSWLFAACCTKSGACCMFRVARCLICVAYFRCPLPVARCLLHGACSVACRGCSLHIA